MLSLCSCSVLLLLLLLQCALLTWEQPGAPDLGIHASKSSSTSTAYQHSKAGRHTLAFEFGIRPHSPNKCTIEA
jgi:hypothetical protein